jgi:UDP-N-acetylmuramoyl-L-alanyl-D-glutamate--2,6-diaminopimelate ligase
VKYLHEILEGIKIVNGTLPENLEIKGIALDSRKVEPGFLFIAVKGGQADGHQYIAKALDNGAVAVLVTDGRFEVTNGHLSVEFYPDILGDIASQFYDYPSESMTIIGITGTNGKTTVGTILHRSLMQLGHKCGLISTVQNLIGDEIEPAELTTPDALTLHALFAKMREVGCSHVVMEVSSHAIHQNRISKVDFDCAIFTNITHDHLDYHHTFSEYIRVKKMFFDSLKPEAIAITNIDDRNGLVMLQNTRATKLHYSLNRDCTYKGRLLGSSLQGLQMQINKKEAFFRLIGNFNAYNLLAAYACLDSLHLAAEIELLTVLSQVQAPEGRLEMVAVVSKQAMAIVDYAHTPDALENVLKTVKDLKPNAIITVIGCGGDRDKSKRPVMAAIAEKLSDKVILTSDNPRTEEPETILDDMEKGISQENQHRVFRIADRSQAIKMAVMLANAGDVILVAGKGHEKYQDVKGVKTPFDDKRKIMEFSRR